MSRELIDKNIIFKNTVFLYLRMFVVIIVQLFTVRIVLEALGESDYGIYNLVGGIVVLFNFLNTTMRGATQRYINFEMGQKSSKLQETFQTSMYLHVCLCILLFIAAESIGLWFVNSKLNIPAEKMFQTNVVYQLSIISVIISTLAVPFNAIIVAHEKMHIYAVAEIIRCVFVLIGAYILCLIKSDRLIIYGVIVLLSTIILNAIYVIFVRRKLTIYKFRLHPDNKLIKPMLSFSGWDLYGNFCVTARTQGINIVLNVIFGVIVNAAAAIATQIHGILLTFGSNVVLAFKPQLYQQYSKGNIKEMQQLAEESTMLSMMLFGVVSMPVVIEMPYILHLWLNEIPEYTIQLARITILTGILAFVNSIINILIQATGKIKALSFISGSIILLTLPAAYLAVKQYNTPESAYWVMMIFAAIIPIISLQILKRKIPEFGIKAYLLNGFTKAILCLALNCLALYLLKNSLNETFLRLVVICFSSVIICGSFIMIGLGGNKNLKKILCRFKK